MSTKEHQGKQNEEVGKDKKKQTEARGLSKEDFPFPI